MIVIILIGMIASVIGYNMKGSLEKGKAFKSEQAQIQIEDILTLQIASGETYEEGCAEALLRKSGLVKNPKEFVKDGWGIPFIITYIDESIEVTSKKLDEYNGKSEPKAEVEAEAEDK